VRALGSRRGATRLVVAAGVLAIGILVLARMPDADRERLADRLSQGVERLADFGAATGAADRLAPLWSRVNRAEERDGPAARSEAAANWAIDRVTALPTSRPWPTPAAAGLPGRPSFPGQLRRLTDGGCCAGAWWSADSGALHFVDRPDGSPTAGVFGVAIWPLRSPVELVDVRLAQRVGASRYVVRPSGGQSTVEDLETGREWTLPTGGYPVRLSPDGAQAVWWESAYSAIRHEALVTVHASAIDGAGQRELIALWGADVEAFLPDNRHVLVTGRPRRDDPDSVLARVDAVSGEYSVLAKGAWLSDVLPSPDGQWVVYMVSLDRKQPEANGLWLVPAVGGPPRRLPFVGAYRWRDGHRLIYVPMEPGAGTHSVWQYDAQSEEATRLLDPAATPLRIADNDWSVAPDGHSLAFLSEVDRNLWVVDLPR
jgi:hypothetical protein